MEIKGEGSHVYPLFFCLLCSTFFSPITASRLVNSERTLTLWQALFRHLAFVCVEAPSHIQTAWWLPPGGQAVYGPVSTALCCDHWAAPAGLRQFMAQSVLRCAGISQFAGLMSVLHSSGNPDLMLPWPRPYRWALIHLYGLRTVILRSKGVLRVEIIVFALYWDSQFVLGCVTFLCEPMKILIQSMQGSHDHGKARSYREF